MSKELFRALDTDIERLLVAGGGTAGADDGLYARRDGFAKLGEKVPFLSKVAEQIGKVQGAKARSAATELLNLGAMSMQLRGAQAGGAKAEGALAAVPATAKLETPLLPFELEPLFYALTNSQPPATRERRKPKRNRVINDAVEKGAVHDLRLIELWVAALADNGVGDTIVEEVIPKLGEAAAPYVQSAYKPDGNSADARRLRALVAVRGAAVKALVDAALEKGSLPVKCAALELLGQLAPAEAEKKCLEMIKEKNQELREGSVRGLAKATSDAALDALIKALDDTDSVRSAAVKVLGELEHKGCTDRLFSLLTPQTLDFKPYKAKPVKKGTRLTPAQQKAAQKEEAAAMRAVTDKTAYAKAVIEALGPRKLTAAMIDKLCEVYKTHAIDEVRVEAGEALLRSSDKKAYETLIANLTSDYPFNSLGANAFFRLDPATAPQRAKPYFSAAALKEKAGVEKAIPIAQELGSPGYHLSDYDHFFGKKKRLDEEEEEAPEAGAEVAEGAEAHDSDDEDEDDEKVVPLDPAWADVLLPALPFVKTSLNDVYAAMGRTGEKKLIKPLIEVFETTKSDHIDIARALCALGGSSVAKVFIDNLSKKASVHACAWALGHLKEKSGVDALIKQLGKGDNDYQIADALARIGDKKAAHALVERLVALKNAYPYYLLNAIKRLDNPEVVPAMKARLEKLKKSKSQGYMANQYESVITYLERDRAVSLSKHRERPWPRRRRPKKPLPPRPRPSPAPPCPLRRRCRPTRCASPPRCSSRKSSRR